MTETGDTTVHEELTAALEAVAEHERLCGRLARLQAAEASAEQAHAEAASTLVDEQEDVRALESFSPTRIWASLRGSRDTDLAQEQAEAQAAEYAVALARTRLLQARREVESVEASMAALGDVHARRAAALSAKEAWLREHDTAAGAALTELSEELARTRSEGVEVREALAAATAAVQALGAAQQLLGQARGWATYDTFFDGGFFGDMAKYDRMDQAAALMRTADLALRRLSAELADVGMGGVGGIEVTGMTRTFDVWFDNIFSDWSVRNRIGEAAQRVDAAARAVHDVAGRLTRRGRDLADAEASLVRRREELLT